MSVITQILPAVASFNVIAPFVTAPDAKTSITVSVVPQITGVSVLNPVALAALGVILPIDTKFERVAVFTQLPSR